MNHLLTCSSALFFAIATGTALAGDEVLEVEIFNATAQVIVPGKDFSWLEAPDATGHDFVIEPHSSLELLYYLPTSRGADLFTYQQGEQACLFGFGHLTPGGGNLDRWAQARSIGSVPISCAAELIAVPDDDEYSLNGGSRVLFTMG